MTLQQLPGDELWETGYKFFLAFEAFTKGECKSEALNVNPGAETLKAHGIYIDTI